MLEGGGRTDTGAEHSIPRYLPVETGRYLSDSTVSNPIALSADDQYFTLIDKL